MHCEGEHSVVGKQLRWSSVAGTLPVQHMASEFMAFRDKRMMEIRSGIAGEARPLHEAPRAQVYCSRE